MEQPHGWEAAITNRIAERVRALRTERRMSAQALSDECERLGYSIPRPTIAKLESGARRSVPIQEVAVLARALGVPPVSLLFNVTAGATPTETTPGQEQLPINAVEWWSGIEPDGGVKLALKERADHRRVLRHAARVVDAHQRYRDFVAGITDESGDLWDSPGDPGEGVEHAEYGLTRALEILRTTRDEMERQGMTPPPVDESIT